MTERYITQNQPEYAMRSHLDKKLIVGLMCATALAGCGEGGETVADQKKNPDVSTSASTTVNQEGIENSSVSEQSSGTKTSKSSAKKTNAESTVRIDNKPDDYESCTGGISFEENLSTAKDIVKLAQANKLDGLKVKLDTISPCGEKVDVDGDGMSDSLWGEALDSIDIAKGKRALGYAKKAAFDDAREMQYTISTGTDDDTPVLRDLNGDGKKNRIMQEVDEGINMYLAKHVMKLSKNAETKADFEAAYALMNGIEGSVDFTMDLNKDGESSDMIAEAATVYNLHAAKKVIAMVRNGQLDEASKLTYTIQEGLGNEVDLNGDGKASLPLHEARFTVSQAQIEASN